MHRLFLTALLAASPFTAPLAQPSAWPQHPITIISGFPPGSGTDIYARKLGEELHKTLGVPFVVEARTGAGGNIASDTVARAAADGYTFLLGTAGSHAINAALYSKLPFDVEKDFTRIAILGDVPNVLLINPGKHPEVKTCADLLALARARPGQMNYSSTGNGASGHLAGVQFTSASKADITHIPYRGQGPAMAALLAGEVDFFFNQSAPSIGPVKSGQVRALAVTSGTRLAALPDVPTVAEACQLPGFKSTTWYGLFGPAKLPAAIQQRMSKEVAQVIAKPEIQTWLADSMGITPPADPSPDAFKTIHEADLKHWAEVVKLSGAKID